MQRLGDLFPDELQDAAGLKHAAPPVQAVPPRARAAAASRAVRICVKDFCAGQDIEGEVVAAARGDRAYVGQSGDPHRGGRASVAEPPVEEKVRFRSIPSAGECDFTR